MDPQLQEDWLDAKLREEAPYLDDGGFTARVVQQLPKSRRSPRALRGVILLGAAVIASLLSFFLAGSFVAETAAFVAALPPRLNFGLAVILALMVMIGGVSAAYLKTRESRL